MTSLRGGEDLAGYIAENYSSRVVEVGVGFNADVALRLVDRGVEVLLTDREDRLLSGLKVEKDDIFSPRPELYRGARLLYSLRPPLEMQLAMGLLGARIGADVLIRPLMDEIARLPGFSRRLVNRGEARFYLFSLEEFRQSGPSSEHRL